MIGGLQRAIGAILGLRYVMKAAVGEWATEALVKKEEQQSHLDALGSQSIGEARAVALKQAMAFELAEIVAELIEEVAIGGQAKAG